MFSLVNQAIFAMIALFVDAEIGVTNITSVAEIIIVRTMLFLLTIGTVIHMIEIAYSVLQYRYFDIMRSC